MSVPRVQVRANGGKKGTAKDKIPGFMSCTSFITLFIWCLDATGKGMPGKQ